MAIHELKCHADPFHAKWHNLKNWEIRKNDRDFKVGDVLIEKEFFPLADGGNGLYGECEIHEEVIWILQEGYGLQEGYIIMSTKQLKRVRVIGSKREEFETPYQKCSSSR